MRELRYGTPQLSRATAYIGTVLQTRDLENRTIEKIEFEDQWKQIRSQSKIWWSWITDSDLNKVEIAKIKYFEFVTRLQLRYELDRQVAKDKIDRRVTEYEAKLKEKTVSIL